MSRSGINPIQELKLIFHLFRIIKIIRPDLVISYTIKPSAYIPILAKLFGCPSLAVVTGLGFAFLTNSVSTILARYSLKLGLNHATHIWFLNDDDKKTVCGIHQDLLNKSSIISGEGINIDYFDDGLFPNLNDKKYFTFLMVSRILIDKGVIEYCEAASCIKKKYPESRFQFLGSIDNNNPAGISPHEWQRLCNKYQIDYLGQVQDIRSIIAAVDVVVLPSYREGIPLVLLEAGAMRRPLIATNVAGCRDVVSDGKNGFLVKPKDSKDLALAMEKMINLSTETFSQMKLMARLITKEKFEISIILERYKAIIIRLLKY